MEEILKNVDWNQIMTGLLLGGAALFGLHFVNKKNNKQTIKSGKNSINIQSQGDTIIGGTKNDKQ